ncbi:probable cytochrome P450 6a14 [Rhodnius prolixus]|uniref:probable cytochrome P450 6a14 n=1 Tax=Rhodnius prolixus TaxID=13249 RepID=UPI003D18DD95
MGPVLFGLLSVFFSLFLYILRKAYKITKYWEERGLPHVKPLLFLGNSARTLFLRLHISELHQTICQQFPNEPVIGFYDFSKPVLLVKDVDLIEKILIKDFVHFTDHGFEIDEGRNPLDTSLFTMTGKRWRALRIKMSPIFTSGKLRYMYGPMDDCGNALLSLLELEQNDVEIKEVLGRFSMDVIGSTAFGIDAKNLAQSDNEFRRMGKRQFETDYLQFVKFIMATNFPKLFKALGITFNKPDVIKYFCELIKNTLEYRKKNNVHRNDFIQMMIQLQEKGYVELQTKDDSDDFLEIDTNTYKTESFEISDDLILGQAFTFLTSGFEASAIVSTYFLYELVKHPSVMKKVKEEITYHAKDNKSLTYDAIREMNYLEQCVKETLRKHSPAPVLFRACTKEYALPNGYIVPVGETVIVPIRAIHYDPHHFPEPNEFRPERFDADRVVHPCAFLPFGNGPRMCIAMRFVMVQLKYTLAKLLMNYDFTLSPKTVEPLTLDNKNFISTPKQRVYLNVTKVNCN